MGPSSKSKVWQNSNLTRVITAKPTDSYIWKSIAKASNICSQAISWTVGNGKEINLWNDKWIYGHKSLRSLIQGPIPNYLSEAPIHSIIESSSWDLSSLSFDLPDEIQNNAFLKLY